MTSSQSPDPDATNLDVGSADTTRQSLPSQGNTSQGSTAAGQSDTLYGASLVGSCLADYVILSRLGKGGMADVYSARDMNLDRSVAIKVLRSTLAKDEDYIRRFRREAKAAAKLNHPNIVQIYDVGQSNSLYYIAQELVEGQNLKQVLESTGPLNAEQAIDVLLGVASALDAAAIKGITHRDIKPENVMRSKTNLIKVADFGLARLGNDADGSRADLTQAGLTLGTPRYMSPEQVQGKPVDPRSDLYSLGVMMYHLVAGQPPFGADDPLALAFAHVNETPQPLDRVRGNKEIPEWIIGIISKLLRKNPDDRFQSPGELLEALIGAEHDHGSGARRFAGAASATAQLQRIADLQKRQAKRKYLQIALGLAIPIALLGVGYSIGSAFSAPPVSQLLQPSTVPAQPTVEEQYIEAMIQNTIPAWRAVSQHFPPEDNANNQSYSSKASLQLSRLYLEQRRPEQALETANAMLGNSSTDRKFRLIALAYRFQAAQALKMVKEQTKARQAFQTLYQELDETNPAAIQLLNRAISRERQMTLGLTPNTPASDERSTATTS